MNYIRQINGFWNWRSQNELSHSQVDLYFAILHVANKCGWKGAFNIPNTTLFGLSQLSKSELHKHRLVLIQKGLIVYKKGQKGKAGHYSISPLYDTNMDTNVDTNMDTNMDTIPKQETETKTKRKRDTSVSPKKRAFVPPAKEEVAAYCLSRKSVVDPVHFWDYFNASNWVDSKGKPVLNWKQKIIVWEKYADESNRGNVQTAAASNGNNGESKPIYGNVV